MRPLLLAFFLLCIRILAGGAADAASAPEHTDGERPAIRKTENTLLY